MPRFRKYRRKYKKARKAYRRKKTYRRSKRFGTNVGKGNVKSMLWKHKQIIQGFCNGDKATTLVINANGDYAAASLNSIIARTDPSGNVSGINYRNDTLTAISTAWERIKLCAIKLKWFPKYPPGSISGSNVGYCTATTLYDKDGINQRISNLNQQRMLGAVEDAKLWNAQQKKKIYIKFPKIPKWLPTIQYEDINYNPVTGLNKAGLYHGSNQPLLNYVSPLSVEALTNVWHIMIQMCWTEVPLKAGGFGTPNTEGAQTAIFQTGAEVGFWEVTSYFKFIDRKNFNSDV